MDCTWTDHGIPASEVGTMTRDAGCIFCRIVAVEIPAAVVFEDDAILAFLDVGPLAEGHLLVIPRDHINGFEDLPAEVAGRIGSVLPRLGKAVREVTKATGFNVLINNGRIAGQIVLHAHVHLIPRRTDDGLGYRWNAGTYSPGRAEALAVEFQRALQHHRP